MTEYRVLDAAPDARRVVLCDQRGSLHLARVAQELPPLGESLRGSYPARGFSLMFAARTGQVYRMIIEALHCDAACMDEWVRPAAAPPAAPEAASGRRPASRSGDVWDGVVPTGRP